jgi:hypothetical protein
MEQALQDFVRFALVFVVRLGLPAHGGSLAVNSPRSNNIGPRFHELGGLPDHIPNNSTHGAESRESTLSMGRLCDGSCALSRWWLDLLSSFTVQPQRGLAC